MKGQKSLFLLFALSFLSIKSFIYKVDILRKWDPERKKYSYFIGCSDFHDKFHEANGPQRQFIRRLLAHCDKARTKVLIEDLASANHNGKSARINLSRRAKPGILAGFTNECKQLGISVTNLEYRYDRVLAVAGLLKNTAVNPYSYKPACAICIGHVKKEFDDAIWQIKQYKDGPQLTKLYQNGIASALKQSKDFNFNYDYKLNIASYLIENTKSSLRNAFIKRLLTFDSVLLDFKFIHETLKSKEPVVVALAGGTHIQRAISILQKMGYKAHKSTSLTYENEPGGGSVAYSKFVVPWQQKRPAATNLQLLMQYIK